MSPAMFGHSSSPQNALLGSATLAPLRWCLIIFGHFGIVGAIWGVGSTCWVQLLTYTVHFEEFRWASFLQTLHQKLTVSCGDVLLCCCWVILRRPQWSSIQPSALSPRWLSQLYTLWLLGDDLPTFLEVFASEPSRLRTLHKTHQCDTMRCLLLPECIAFTMMGYDGICTVSRAQWPWRNVSVLRGDNLIPAPVAPTSTYS